MFITLFLMIFSFPADTTDTFRQEQPVPDQIKMMVVEGEVHRAIRLLEEAEEEGTAGVGSLVLLLNLYSGEFRFGPVAEVFERHEDRLSQNEDAVYAYAQAKLKSGYKDEAAAVLEAFREREPSGAKALILLGTLYFDDEAWEAAGPVYDEITDRVPGNPLFRTQQARIYSRLGREEAAKEILLGVLDAEPAYLPAMLELVSLYYRNSETEKAKNLTDRGLMIYPEESRFWDFSGRIAYTNQRYERAAEQWLRVVELGDAEMGTYRGIGLCYYQLSRPEEALEYFGRTLAMNPEDTISLLYSAMVYRQMEEWEKARDILDRLFDIHGGEYLTDVVMQRAVVYEALGEIDAAVSEYKLAKRLDPEQRSADFYLAALYDRHLEDKAVALEHYRSYLENGEPDPELEEYAKGRIRVLVEKLHFEQGANE